MLTNTVAKQICKKHRHDAELIVTEHDKILRFYWLMETKHEILRWAKWTILGAVLILTSALLGLFLPAYLKILKIDDLAIKAEKNLQDTTVTVNNAQTLMRAVNVHSIQQTMDDLVTLQAESNRVNSEIISVSDNFNSLKANITAFSEQDLRALEDRLTRELAILRAEVDWFSLRGLATTSQLVSGPAPVSPTSTDLRFPKTVFDTQAMLEWTSIDPDGSAEYQLDVWYSDPESDRLDLPDPDTSYRTKETQQLITINDLRPFRNGRLWWRVSALDTQGILTSGPIAYFDVYQNSLDRILSTGVALVGISPSDDWTFVRRPVSQEDSMNTNGFEGFDIDLAESIVHNLPQEIGRLIRIKQISSSEVELAQRFEAQAPDLRVNFVPKDWNTLFASLQSHQVDFIISGISITKAREQRFSMRFSSPYYITQQAAVFLNRNAPESTNELLKSTIAVVKGTTSQNAAQRFNPEAIVQLDRTEQVVESVINGSVDFGLADYTDAWKVAQRMGALKGLSFRVPVFRKTSELTQENTVSEKYGIAVSEEDSGAMLAAINSMIISDSGSSFLEEIRMKHGLSVDPATMIYHN